MKLFYSPTSPYVRKVMMVLEMAGMTGQVELVPGGGTPLNPNEATVGSNPLGKVPALVTDDGTVLFDSRVITRYLDHVAATGLYPSGDALFPVLTIEALTDGVLDAALLVVYEGRLRPEEKRHQPWTDAQRSKVVRGIAALEAYVDDVLLGATTAAHLSAAATLGYLDFRFPDLGWRDTAPKLADWYTDFSQKPYMRATEPHD